MKNKKTFWPYAIIGVMLSFMGFIAYLVTSAVNSDWQLVSEDYYQKEIEYESRIQMLKRTAALEIKPTAVFLSGEEKIKFELPESLIPAKVNVVLFRPGNAGDDKNFDMHFGQASSMSLNTSGMKKGLWRVKMTIDKEKGETFYLEKKIMID